jgi:Fe2+ transport system protein FeoA
MKLAFAEINKSFKIKAILGGRNFKQRLEEIGIIPGKTITVLQTGPGPVLIKSDNVKIGLGFGEALKIEVEQQ